MKQIYRCIDISIQNISGFMNGQIGLQLKDLLFGVDGMATSIPRGIPNLNLVAPFSCIPSQANQTRGVVTGNRKRKHMRPGSSFKNRKFRRPGIQPVNVEQVQQAMPVETSLPKKMRTDEGWRGMPYAAAQVEGQFGTPHVDPTSSHQRNRGWGEMCAGGWEQSKPSGAGGWEETYNKPRGGGWGVSQHNGWGAIQQAGWGVGNQQHSSGGWGSWEATQQPNVGVWGVGGWGGIQQHIGGGGADHRAYSTRF